MTSSTLEFACFKTAVAFVPAIVPCHRITIKLANVCRGSTSQASVKFIIVRIQQFFLNDAVVQEFFTHNCSLKTCATQCTHKTVHLCKLTLVNRNIIFYLRFARLINESCRKEVVAYLKRIRLANHAVLWNLLKYILVCHQVLKTNRS